jgi:hypothetical protein
MKDPFELNAKSIMALYELFPTEEACIKHLEAINWHGKPALFIFGAIRNCGDCTIPRFKCGNHIQKIFFFLVPYPIQ